jgi:hypothetical protein
LAPGCPLPAFTVTRVSVSGDPLTNTAMLENGVALAAVGAFTESNSKSWNVTPVVSPLTCSAYCGAPDAAAGGATFVCVLALYAHVAQLNPPYTVTPSSAAVTVTGVVNVPHAYTRLVAAAATPMA